MCLWLLLLGRHCAVAARMNRASPRCYARRSWAAFRLTEVNVKQALCCRNASYTPEFDQPHPMCMH